MKKNLLLWLFLSLIIVSCTKNETLIQNSVDAFSRIRSIEEARSLAEMSINLLEGESNQTKANHRRIVDGHTFALTTKASACDTLFYVFNFDANQGFSIIAADKTIEPIIAVTEEGYYEAGKPTSVPPFDAYMSEIISDLATGSTNNSVTPPIPYYYYTTYSEGSSISPLLGTTRWGQQSIYGQFCPNGIAGCFATAVAQIFKKHQYPASFTCSCDMGNEYSANEIVTLDWTKIKQHYYTHTDTQNCDVAHSQIGALMRQIGHVGNTSYGASSSGTAPSMIYNVLAWFGYDSSDIQAANTTSMKQSINNGCPVFMFGYLASGEGHAWVADGYKDITYYRDKYAQAYGDGEYARVEHTITSESHCLHINWGWNGNCNGYFTFNTYNTAESESYDTSSNSAAYNFTQNLKMLCNISPAN